MFPNSGVPGSWGVSAASGHHCINTSLSGAPCLYFDYNNGDIIDTCTTIVSFNPKQPFNVERDPRASVTGIGLNAFYCATNPPQILGCFYIDNETGDESDCIFSSSGCPPISGQTVVNNGCLNFIRTCPCYEVSDNDSDAWGPIAYTVWPHDYFHGCSGTYFVGDPYLNCSRTFIRCVADICHSNKDERFAPDLPYCLGQVVIPDGHNIGQFAAGGFSAPEPCNGPIETPSMGVCDFYYGDDGSQVWITTPNVINSGCNKYIIHNVDSTYLTVSWGQRNVGGFDTPPNCSAGSAGQYCSCPTHTTVYNCQTKSITFCDRVDFEQTVAYDYTGYLACPICTVNDGCCNGNQSYSAPLPLTVNATLNYPNAPALNFSGPLTLDNVNWAGQQTWVTTPFTVACTGDLGGYGLSIAGGYSVNYQGWDTFLCCAEGAGCGRPNNAKCYQNNWTLSFVYVLNVQQCNFDGGANFPNLFPGGFVKFPWGDCRNTVGERECVGLDGSPLGTFPCLGGDCCNVPGPGGTCATACFRDANPSSANIWNNESCCEAYAECTALGGGCPDFYIAHPECINQHPLDNSNVVNIDAQWDLCSKTGMVTATNGDGDVIWSISL